MRRKNDSFIDHLERYFNSYLPTAKGLSKATIVSYKTTFRLLMEYLYTVDNITSDSISFDTLDDKRITDFLNWLETERKCGIATRNQRLSAIAAFSIYVQNRDLTAAKFRNNVLKVPKKKAPRQGRSSFTREEIKILLSLPVSGTEIGSRDKTLLCFMYASGTRAQEVCDLMVGDIQFYPDRASINIHGKGQKMRRIGIPMEAASILHKYIEHRGILDEADRHVFSSQTHEKMSVSCIEEIYAKYIAKAKLQYPDMFRDNYTPHSMRHTTATHMLDAGVPIIVVKNFLGHVSLQTTQIYTEITQDTMNRQLKSWNDKWFLKDDGNGRQDSANKIIPDFLR
ncbi:Site-specific recombinase XerD [Eubacterium ruminantium]|nr:Site-specific recombinase XerD [Eubacterium ruminantium]SEG39392.1 Site-specific recombinase XerD [Eubacterium ruminantium]